MENKKECGTLCSSKSKLCRPWSQDAVDTLAMVIVLGCIVTGIIYWLNSFSY